MIIGVLQPQGEAAVRNEAVQQTIGADHYARSLGDALYSVEEHLAEGVTTVTQKGEDRIVIAISTLLHNASCTE